MEKDYIFGGKKMINLFEQNWPRINFNGRDWYWSDEKENHL